jgi:hypothetical protein
MRNSVSDGVTVTDENVTLREGALMHNVTVQKAAEMPPALKAAVEQLLGRAISGDEEISIVAVPPRQVAPSGGKAAIVQKLEALLDRRVKKVHDIPEEEINTVIDEAVHHARHNRT